jgi:hypothetical protein
MGDIPIYIYTYIHTCIYIWYEMLLGSAVKRWNEKIKEIKRSGNGSPAARATFKSERILWKHNILIFC